MIGYGLRPAGVLRECRRWNSQALREPGHQRIDRLVHVRQGHAGMPQQRELHGEAQAIRVAAPHGQKLLVGSSEAVVARQCIRIVRHAEEQPARVLGQQLSARHRRLLRPRIVRRDRGRRPFRGRILWTEARQLAGACRARPENGRLGDGMGDILGYARVCTADQDVAGQSMRLTQAGAIKVFTDIRSGRSMDRPGLDSLLAYAREGDTLAVVRLDRLGRSLGELLATVAMLRARGIALLSLEEKINTASAAGELVFHVFGAIAHFERRLIAERPKHGIAAARARGKRPGRQPLEADKIAAALKLVQAGLSPTAAARQLGLGRSTVYRELSRSGIERVTQPG